MFGWWTPQAPGVAPRTRTLGIAVDVVAVGALGVTVSAVGAWGVARVGWEEELGTVGVGASSSPPQAGVWTFGGSLCRCAGSSGGSDGAGKSFSTLLSR